MAGWTNVDATVPKWMHRGIATTRSPYLPFVYQEKTGFV